MLKNDTLILSSSPVAVQDILKRWDGKHSETLADVPAYKAIVESSNQGHTPPVVLGYVNPIALVQAFVRSNDSAAENLGMAMAFLPVLGLDNLKAIGGSMHLVTDEYDSETRLQIYLDRPASGLLSVFTFPPTNQAPPKWVTDDSSSYHRAQLGRSQGVCRRRGPCGPDHGTGRHGTETGRLGQR